MHLPDNERRHLARLSEVPIECSVELGRTTMPLRDALELRPGSFVATNRLAEQPVEFHVAGRLVAYGQIVVIDEELGIRITELAHSHAAPVDDASASGWDANATAGLVALCGEC